MKPLISGKTSAESLRSNLALLGGTSRRSRKSKVEPFQASTRNIVWNYISPIDFCMEWFGYGHLSAQEQEDIKRARDFRPRCIKLLSELLGRSPSAIYKWGRSFDKMPKRLAARLPEILAFNQFWAQFRNLPPGTQGVEVRYQLVGVIQPQTQKSAKKVNAA
jgi:hypothetical protein